MKFMTLRCPTPQNLSNNKRTSLATLLHGDRALGDDPRPPYKEYTQDMTGTGDYINTVDTTYDRRRKTSVE